MSESETEWSPLLAAYPTGAPPAYSVQANDEYRATHTSRTRAYTRRIRQNLPLPVSDNAGNPNEQGTKASFALFYRKVALSHIVPILVILLVLMTTSTVILAVGRFRDTPDSEQREHVRKEWRREELAHYKQHKQWDTEKNHWEQDRRQWEIEKASHEAEDRRWDMERKQWEIEKARHEAEDRRLDMERKQWKRERLQWEIEKARHEAEDRRWEKERLRRMRLYWGPLWRNDHCRSYGTREYTARLWNIAPGADGLAVCMQMPMTINDMSILPSECEDRGFDGVHGRWLVDYGEVTCQPYWDALNDKGCIDHRLGLRRFEARLQNINSGDDWQVMCDTAPNVINGIEFKHPTSCENRGMFSGMVGIWEVPDTNCKN